jgi:hypothetical protein
MGFKSKVFQNYPEQILKIQIEILIFLKSSFWIFRLLNQNDFKIQFKI